jgi:hypothetical protein
MRTRASIDAKAKIDYKYEATRPMCEGCNHTVGRTLTGYVCQAYKTKPSMYVRANECPCNSRLRPIVGGKVRAGQGKTKAGGNA